MNTMIDLMKLIGKVSRMYSVKVDRIIELLERIDKNLTKLNEDKK